MNSTPAAQAAGTTSKRAKRGFRSAPRPALTVERRAAPQAAPPSVNGLGCLLQVLGFCSGGVRLQPMQIIGGLLRVAGGGA